MAERSPESTTGLKVLAVLMAIALWGFVVMSQRVGAPDQARRLVSVVVDVEHPPPFERVHAEPAIVDVVVEGPAKAVDHLAEGDVSAFVDLQFHHVADRRAPVMVSVPDGMKYQVVPDFVSIVRTQGR